MVATLLFYSQQIYLNKSLIFFLRSIAIHNFKTLY